MHPELAALSLLTKVPSFGTAKALKTLYDALSTALPDDIESTPISCPPNLPSDANPVRFNYDEGHSGRFMLPDTQGASLDFHWVMSQPNPLSFMTSHLAVKPPFPVHNPEHVVFMPGLNTLQQPASGETTTEQRLKFYVKVLQCIPMAQLHPGSSKDQQDARVKVKRAYVLRLTATALSPVLPDRMAPRRDGEYLIWSGSQLDYIQAVLSRFDLIDTPLKARIRDLLDYSAHSSAEPVVLVGYSRSSIDLKAALDKHIKQSVDKGEPLPVIEARLRRKVTAVTIGSGTAGFPDGPAYVHIATYQDPLAKTIGVTSRHNADKAGKEALFVNLDSIFAKGAFDAHNFGAITVQYLSILMVVNKAWGFRALWEKRNCLHIPGNVEDLVKALIVMTDATPWLLSPKQAWKDRGDDFLPNGAIAEKVLRAALGDEYVEGIVKSFGRREDVQFGPKWVRDHGDEQEDYLSSGGESDVRSACPLS